MLFSFVVILVHIILYLHCAAPSIQVTTYLFVNFDDLACWRQISFHYLSRSLTHIDDSMVFPSYQVA